MVEIDNGVKKYLFQQKSKEQKVLRELWNQNGATYDAYRRYIRQIKEYGFPINGVFQNDNTSQFDSTYKLVRTQTHKNAPWSPDSQQLPSQQRATTAKNSLMGSMEQQLSINNTLQQFPLYSEGSLKGDTLKTPTKQSQDYAQVYNQKKSEWFVKSSKQNSVATPNNNSNIESQNHNSRHNKSKIPMFAFQGMKYVVENCKNVVTIIKFARYQSDMLAFGDQKGQLWVTKLDSTQGNAQQSDTSHRCPVVDLDWSYDGKTIVSCGGDCSVICWQVQNLTQILRITMTGGPSSIKHYALNQNILLLGTKRGDIGAYNLISGAITCKSKVPNGGRVTQITSEGSYIFAGSEYGQVHMFKANLRGPNIESLRWVAKTSPPGSSLLVQLGQPVTQLDIMSYSVFTKGAALLVYTQDSFVSVYSINEKALNVELKARAKFLPAPRKIGARFCPIFCPSDAISNPEFIAVGSQEGNVYIIDIHSTHYPQQPDYNIVNTLMGHSSPVVDVSWSHDAQLLASADCSGCVIVWSRDLLQEVENIATTQQATLKSLQQKRFTQ